MITYSRRDFVAGLLLISITAASTAVSASTTTNGDKMSERNSKLDAILAKAMPEVKAHWQSCREAGLEAMTPAATDSVDDEILSYFGRLKALNVDASDSEILAEMKRLYQNLNAINAASDYGLLETDERELLVTVFIEAAEASGIDSAKYDGEPGGEFRDF